jgi:exodeoxyribonuclease VII large subunit
VGAVTSLERAVARQLASSHRALDRARARLAAHEPHARLAHDRERLASLERRLGELARAATLAARRELEDLGRTLRARGAELGRERRAELALLAGKLDALSPLGILARGYAIALHGGRAVVRATDVGPGDTLELRLHEGSLEARVEAVRGKDDR